MAEQKVKEEFNIFADDIPETKNYPSTKKTSKKDAGRLSYEEREANWREGAEKVVQKKKRRKKRIIIELSILTVWIIAAVFSFTIFAIRDANNKFYDKNLILAEAEGRTPAIYHRETLYNLTIDGIVCDYDNPYGRGTIEINQSDVADNLEKITILLYVLPSEEYSTKTTNQWIRVEIPYDEAANGIYDFTFPVSVKDVLFDRSNVYNGITVSEDYVVDVSGIIFRQRGDIVTQLWQDDMSKNIILYNNEFFDNKVTQYNAPFSDKHQDYTLNMVEFGQAETIVGFKCSEASQMPSDRKKIYAKKMADQAYITADGKKYKNLEKYQINQGVWNSDSPEYYITFSSIPNTSQDVKLVIGDTTFELR